MENGNKKEKVITRMAAYDWLKVMGTLMVVIDLVSELCRHL